MAVAALLLLLPDGLCWAEERPTADTARQEIPWDELSPEAHRKATQLVEDTVLFRRMPTEVFRCDPQVYLFLVNHPDVTTAIWRVLGMSQLNLQQSGDQAYAGGDGRGTDGSCEFLYRSPETHVVLCRGSYQGALLPRPIEASALLVLRSAYFQEEHGQGYVAHRLDAYIHVEAGAAEALTRLTSPLTLHMADRTFHDVTLFLAAMSHWLAQRADWAYRLADRLTDIPAAEKTAFRALVEDVLVRQQALARRRAESQLRLTR